MYCLFVFFFQQKTAYGVRISDWSSDVCSSDLVAFRRGRGLFHFGGHVLRLLVLPQPKETRVAHRSARGEFGEGDFGDEFGFQPMDLARGDLVDLERRGLAFELRESLREVGEAAGVEAGADVALVDERIDRKSTRLNSSH